MLYLRSPVTTSRIRDLRASVSTTVLPGFHHVVFPDLCGAGPRHVVNFAPPSAAAPQRPLNDPFSQEDEFCLRWLFRQAGLNVNHYRPETLQRRIPGLLRALHARSLPEARLLVRADLTLLPGAMDALLIGVTSFFRDPEVAEALRNIAIPELAGRHHPLWIWGTACSDGSELFSLALLLAESGLLHRSGLLGTDCRVSAVCDARRGEFPHDALRELDPALERRYFHARGNARVVSPVIQRRITWRQADVLQEIEPGEWDMILCRNLSIYLQPGVTGELWSRLRGALRRDGLLLTGKAERPTLIGGFRQLGLCLYQRED